MLAQRIAIVVALAAAAWWLPDLRRALIFDLTYWDARPGDPPELPSGDGPGLGKTPRTRVVLIDGLSAELTPQLPVWTATCKRGLALTVDVGFPTVSLPVEVALWTGLTQQQTGIVNRGGGKDGKYGRPIEPPITGIPSQIQDSVAIAEDHGWIVRSLGFHRTRPNAGEHPVDDFDPDGWKNDWEWGARYAIASNATLVFVHVLRVDSAGHRFGASAHYGAAAASADAILGRLIAADPQARWFLLSDHGQLGTHGGEERELRHVQACIAGPGVAAGHGPLVHIVDVSRAIADSTGAKLDNASRGRPLAVALAAPLADDQAVPPVPLSRGAVAIFILVAGLAASAWSVRTWWAAPWWLAVSIGALLIIDGEPTLSMSWVYARDGRDMLIAFAPGALVAAAATYVALGKTTHWRVLAAQLALPLCVLAACITAAGAWPAVLGADEAPTTPRYSAWMTALILVVASGAAAVALGVLARLVRPRFGRSSPAAPPRSAPAAGA